MLEPVDPLEDKENYRNDEKETLREIEVLSNEVRIAKRALMEVRARNAANLKKVAELEDAAEQAHRALKKERRKNQILREENQELQSELNQQNGELEKAVELERALGLEKIQEKEREMEKVTNAGVSNETLRLLISEIADRMEAIRTYTLGMQRVLEKDERLILIFENMKRCGDQVSSLLPKLLGADSRVPLPRTFECLRDELIDFVQKSKRDLIARDMQEVEREKKRNTALIQTLEESRKELKRELDSLKEEKKIWMSEKERIKQNQFQALQKLKKVDTERIFLVKQVECLKGQMAEFATPSSVNSSQYSREYQPLENQYQHIVGLNQGIGADYIKIQKEQTLQPTPCFNNHPSPSETKQPTSMSRLSGESSPPQPHSPPARNQQQLFFDYLSVQKQKVAKQIEAIHAQRQNVRAQSADRVPRHYPDDHLHRELQKEYSSHHRRVVSPAPALTLSQMQQSQGVQDQASLVNPVISPASDASFLNALRISPSRVNPVCSNHLKREIASLDQEIEQIQKSFLAVLERGSGQTKIKDITE